MTTSLKLLLALTTTALLASCAYEADPGLQPKGASEQTVDSLKTMDAAKKLATKYGSKDGGTGSIVAKCELTFTKTPVAALSSAELTADDPGTPAGEPGLVLKGTNAFELDLNAQAAPKAVEIKTLTVALEDGSKVEVKSLKLEAVAFTAANVEKMVPLVDKDGKPVNDAAGKQIVERHIYVMKHSPVLKYSTSAVSTVAGVGTPTDKADLTIIEKVSTEAALTANTVGSDRYVSSLKCVIDTKVNDKDAKIKDELLTQWEDVNCGPNAAPKAAAAAPADDKDKKGLNPICAPPAAPKG